MSIVALKHLLVTGLSDDKAKTLAGLQDLGCLELVPLRETESVPGAPLRPKSHEALHFLLSCPRRRHQVTRDDAFDPEEIERRALELAALLDDRQNEHDAIVQTIRDLRPWGDFQFPPLDALGGQRLWFYAVPRKEMGCLHASSLVWFQAAMDDKACYVVVVNASEPEGLPFPRVRAGHRSPEALRIRLETVIVEIEDLQDQRAALSRWATLLAAHLGELEDRDARLAAEKITLDNGKLFALAGWIPATQVPAFESHANQLGLAWEVRDPLPEEAPPTLLQNPPALEAGESLVTFYMTPGYRTWDPSPIVLFSFALFFAMILADAGYGAVFTLITAILWKRLATSHSGRTFRRLLALLSLFSLVFGVLTGGYFGVAPPPDSLAAKVAVVDLENTNAMMVLSVIIGVLHIVLANVMNAVRHGWSPAALAPLGWASAILGGFLWAASNPLQLNLLQTGGMVLLALGALLIFLFSGVGQRPLKRIVSGLFAFTKITAAFGDVLSYLRLFALGLASASLAAAFNDMAGQVHGAVAGGGLLLALLVLLIGHTLNFVLSLSSAVIHGMRLNLIEFFNWSLTEEGKAFQPFRKKSATP